MVTCVKCSEDIPNSKDVLVCAECKGAFHPTCTRVATIDNFKKLSSQRKSTFKCDTCKAESGSIASRSSDSEPTILASIQALGENLGAQIRDVNSNVDSVKVQLATVNSTIESMKQTMSTLVAENESRKSECEKLCEENKELKEGIAVLEAKMRDLDQYSRRDNIEIVGVPFSRGENVYQVLESISNLIGIRYNINSFSVAHRLQATKDRPDPNIIVRFVARECKQEWLRAAWENREKMKNAELSDSWPSTRFFINEHLSAYNKAILGRARRLVKEKKLAFAWTRECKVFVKKTADPNSPIKYLKTMEDVELLAKE